MIIRIPKVRIVKDAALELDNVAIARHGPPMDVRIRGRFLVGIVHVTRPVEHRGGEGTLQRIFDGAYEMKKFDHFILGQIG